ncbi:DUF892 family protein [Aestuariimicrobium ganziense]|uniref:DUF892 family protein n=1 Tax=Aestuariimicrobium ganziense TaxID=2773677 RepID=UPI0019424AF7|nr:DUF892 family protein [Aestuariimicrobium ganziense]
MSEQERDAGLLGTYLQDHHAAASAGVDAFRRVAANHSRADVRARLEAMADQIAQDKESLEQIMELVDANRSVLKDTAARIAEKASRLKPNNRIVQRSPLSDYLELEALTGAVHMKSLLWKALLELGNPRLDALMLQQLLDRAHEQQRQLDELRAGSARVLAGD